MARKQTFEGTNGPNGPPADKRELTTKYEKNGAYFKNSIYVESFLKNSMIYHKR